MIWYEMFTLGSLIFLFECYKRSKFILDRMVNLRPDGVQPMLYFSNVFMDPTLGQVDYAYWYNRTVSTNAALNLRLRPWPPGSDQWIYFLGFLGQNLVFNHFFWIKSTAVREGSLQTGVQGTEEEDVGWCGQLDRLDPTDRGGLTPCTVVGCDRQVIGFVLCHVGLWSATFSDYGMMLNGWMRWLHDGV